METPGQAFFDSIRNAQTTMDAPRKQQLQLLIDYILQKQRENETVKLNFICTHNSRRSHMAQLLAAAAATHEDLENIECYSGGTEVKRVHPNTLSALESIGFQLSGANDQDQNNPRYLCKIGDSHMMEVFSKKFDDEINPTDGFAAIMVCSDAEQNCPFVPGTERRITVTYDDPKSFDQDENPVEGYLSRCREIGSEMQYVMETVSNALKT